jgi:hypothetical protein
MPRRAINETRAGKPSSGQWLEWNRSVRRPHQWLRHGIRDPHIMDWRARPSSHDRRWPVDGRLEMLHGAGTWPRG